MRVTVEPATETPLETLAEILAPFDLKARTGPAGSILIVRVEDHQKSRSGGSIYGAVREPAEGRLISNVEITLAGASEETVTASNGRFSFSGVSPGEYQLTARHPVYLWETTETVDVSANQAVVAMIELGAPKVAKLRNVVVGASQYELLRSVGASRTLFTSAMIEDIPDIGDDPLRAVKRLPGTTSGGVSANRTSAVARLMKPWSASTIYDFLTPFI